jgi:hypothetical protein
MSVDSRKNTHKTFIELTPEEVFWVETCCENLNEEKSKVLFVGVYFCKKL